MKCDSICIAMILFRTFRDALLNFGLLPYIRLDLLTGNLCLASPAQGMVNEPPPFPSPTYTYIWHPCYELPVLFHQSGETVSDTFPLPDDICPYMAGSLELTVLPRPQRAWFPKFSALPPPTKSMASDIPPNPPLTYAYIRHAC